MQAARGAHPGIGGRRSERRQQPLDAAPEPGCGSADPSFVARLRPGAALGRRTGSAPGTIPGRIGTVTGSSISGTALRRRGIRLEAVTLGWNVVAVPLLGYLAASASSVALLGFGLDSLIEIAASVVVVWELTGTGEQRRRRALRLIGFAFLALAAYLLIQSAVALTTGHRAAPSPGGLIWTGVTALVMFGLAAGKRRTGRELGNEVLITEGRVTLIDGLLACAVLVGVALDLLLGWWWADPLAGLVLVVYAAREAVVVLRPPPADAGPLTDGNASSDR
jgi:Cation efflux family